MHLTSLLVTSAIVSLGGASIIPRGTAAHAVTGIPLHNAYGRRAAIDINVALEPQNYADVQSDRRKAFGESL
ncbi:hypothetical protein NPX13_g6223 [Xylaria arbuscula]|uniref:Uncharacterized protein n=1 Tax=Xylaria arbuscula TaxID=114810 RepID=A0A9W8ND14_9PEZI|nr:hypothetical protein NPX13_g6223 [Xylaria arbuscula]